MLLASLALLPLLASSGTPLASEGPPPILQPADYASPSGKFVLHVDPSRRDGGGPGAYRMTRDGEPVWEKTLDVTAWRASVADDGRVAGYGYTAGWRDHRLEGEFRVIILDAGGELVANAATKREGSRYLHSPPVPLAAELLLQPELDRLRIRVIEKDQEYQTRGWEFRLSSGERLNDWEVEPPVDLERDSEGFINLRMAAALPNSGLILLCWNYMDGESTQGTDHWGHIYELRNAADESVWREDRPLDLVVPGDVETTVQLSFAIQSHDTLLETAPGGHFALWSPSEATRSDYIAREVDDQWKVERTAVEAFVPVENHGPTAEPITLERLGRVRLLRTPESLDQELGDVRAFGFTAEDTVVYLRAVDSGYESVHLTADGAIESTRAIELPAQLRGPLDEHWAGDDRWMLSHRTGPRSRSSELYRADARTGQVQALGEFPVIDIRRILPTPEGGNVMLATFYDGYGTRAVVMCIGEDGEILWRQDQARGGYARDDLIRSPVDMAITAEGLIALLEPRRRNLQLFDGSGAHVRNQDLGEVFGTDATYFARVVADSSGGVWIADQSRFVRVDAEGEVSAPLEPRFGGSAPSLRRELRADSRGRLWNTDGVMIASTDELGNSGATFGRTRTDAPPLTASAAHIDRRGRVWLLDEDRNTWHAFSADGAALHSCELPRPFSTTTLDRPTSTADGSLWVPASRRSNYKHHQVFSPEGELGEHVNFEESDVESDTHGEGAWRLARYEGHLEHLDVERVVDRRLPRRPDHLWWRNPRAFHHSACGARFVVLDTGGGGGSNAPPALAVFDGEGNGLDVIELPRRFDSQVATSAEWAAVWDSGASITLVDLQGRRVQRFAIDAAGHCEWGFSPDGTELWCVDLAAITLHRFALPTD